MNLGQLIDALEDAPQDYVAPLGFGTPHSYRGYYEDVAFSPAQNVPVCEMLAWAKYALNRKFDGYKGGVFTMHPYVDCYIADYDTSSGDKIGPTLVAYMTGRA